MKYHVTLNNLSKLLEQFTNEGLTKQQRLYIFESFKVHRNAEDNPDELGECLVSVRELVSTRIRRKNKRIDDVIAIHKEDI